MRRLTNKQQHFCEEYIIDSNGTQAAIRAGYSKNTANEQSTRLLSKAHIQDQVTKLVQKRSEETKIDSNWVLVRAALLANFNIKKFITVGTGGKAWYDFSNATDDDWYCISEMTVDVIPKSNGDDKYEVDRVKLKTFDRLRALELVGKHVDVQAFKERQEVTGPDGGPQELKWTVEVIKA